MNIFKNNIALYIFLTLAVSIGWAYNKLGRSFVKKYDIITMLLIETVVILAFYFIYLSISTSY